MNRKNIIMYSWLLLLSKREGGRERERHPPLVVASMSDGGVAPEMRPDREMAGRLNAFGRPRRSSFGGYFLDVRIYPLFFYMYMYNQKKKSHGPRKRSYKFQLGERRVEWNIIAHNAKVIDVKSKNKPLSVASVERNQIFPEPSSSLIGRGTK